MKEWLNFLRLGEYNDMLTRQGYTDIDIVTGIMWEDLEDIGIRKLGVNSVNYILLIFFKFHFCLSNDASDNHRKRNINLPFYQRLKTICANKLNIGLF